MESNGFGEAMTCDTCLLPMPESGVVVEKEYRGDATPSHVVRPPVKKRPYNKVNKDYWGDKPAIGKVPKPDSQLISEMLIEAEAGGYRKAITDIYGGRNGNNAK